MANDFPISEKFFLTARKFPVPLYLVGGGVRNAVLGKPVSDRDACSACPTERAAELFREAGYSVVAEYRRFGTLKLLDSLTGETVEYTRFRTDSYRAGGEHAPEQVVFTDRLEEDARRRDFRMNALYFDVVAGRIEDPLGGLADLAEGVIRCADDPEKVFSEDGLRLLRLARFSAELGFRPAPETLAAARKFRDNLDAIVPERVAEEMRRIAFADVRYGVSGGHERGLRLLDEIGLLEKILPEITAGKGMEQRKDFHRFDVFGHTLETFRVSPPEVRIAALLHDVGKPVCFRASGNYHGHERVSGELAGPLARRVFGVSRREAERISALCALHMADLKCEMRESRRRLFLAEHADLLSDLFVLKQADYVGCGWKNDLCPTVERMQRTLAAMREEGAPLTLAELRVNGGDVLERVPDLPRQQIGEVLSALFRDCVLGILPNDRERLLARLDRLKERRKSLSHA